jgi:hypothetical protein
MISGKPTYDEALFLQKLRSYAKNGAVTYDQVADAFWIVAWDLEEAILQQKPEKLEEAQAVFKRDFLPKMIPDIVLKTGLKVVS